MAILGAGQSMISQIMQGGEQGVQQFIFEQIQQSNDRGSLFAPKEGGGLFSIEGRGGRNVLFSWNWGVKLLARLGSDLGFWVRAWLEY